MVPWYISGLNIFIANAIEHIVLVRPPSVVEGRGDGRVPAVGPGWPGGFCVQDMKSQGLTSEKFLERHYTFEIQIKVACFLSRNTQKKK